MEEETKKLWPKEQGERAMTQPITEGECIILLDPEDNKEFLYKMRVKEHILLIKNLPNEEANQ